MSKKYKIFYDTVHGNIKIPIEYCDKIIDTIYFQRLRRIEQTSMRSLFPCAHHDRFVHSIGTYYLGKRIFECVIANSESILKEITKEKLEELQKTYEIACLLHDCGHAPFSHTFEKYYGMSTELNDSLKRESNDSEFRRDFEKVESQPKEHERLSAILVIKIFGKTIKELGGIPLIAARMIIGCCYSKPQGTYEKLVNCFISLLNGHIIDADRLDYICRDKWASGYSSATVNIERLLSAISIKESDNNEYFICFHKSAINEIHNLLNNKDFQYSSVISHHKVVYDQYILEKAVEKLMELLNDEAKSYNEKYSKGEDKIPIQKLFNINSFFESTPVGIRECIYLPTDDDIVHLLKEYLEKNPFAQEWFSRYHKLKPLWKSLPEYHHFFKDLPSKYLQNKGCLRGCVEGVLKNLLKRHSCDENLFLILEAKQSVSKIQKNKLFLFLNGNRVSYDELKISANKKAPYLFCIYLPPELLKNKKQIINSLIDGAKKEAQRLEKEEKLEEEKRRKVRLTNYAGNWTQN